MWNFTVFFTETQFRFHKELNYDSYMAETQSMMPRKASKSPKGSSSLSPPVGAAGRRRESTWQGAQAADAWVQEQQRWSSEPSRGPGINGAP